MPFTFLAHQLPVLPLKMALPRWLDGTALVIGSMAPDLAYAFAGTPLAVNAHALPAQLWWCLPVAVVLTVLVKRVGAAPLAAHLPANGPLATFRLRDYGAIERWPLRPRRDAAVLVVSALLGSLSHIALDAATHADGGLVTRVPWLAASLPDGLGPLSGEPVYDALQHLGSVVAAVAVIAMLATIGRRGLVRRWCGPPPALGARRTVDEAAFASTVVTSTGRVQTATVVTTLPLTPPVGRTSAAVLWGWTAVGALLAVALHLAVGATSGTALLLRVILGGFVGLVVGSVAVRRTLAGGR